jgi:hypothetical protein
MNILSSDFLMILLLGALMGIVGQGARAVVGVAKARARSGGFSLLAVFYPIRLLLSLVIGAFVGVGAALVFWDTAMAGAPTSTELLLAALAGYAGTDFIEGYLKITIEAPAQWEEAQRGTSKSKIEIRYRLGASVIERPPACLLRFEDLPQPVRLEGPGNFAVELPDTAYFRDAGIRIVFSVEFEEKGQPVEAIARVWRPEAIFLTLEGPRRMVGTIRGHGAVSFGAAAIDQGCDIMCLPPAEQTSGPGRCVTCKTNVGVFELCF